MLIPFQVVASGPALLLSFEDAIRLAGEKPPAVVMSHERVQQAVARLAQARTSLYPQLSAAASETRRTVNLAAQGITIPGVNPLVGPFNTFDARIKLTQALFDAETLQGLRYAEAGQALATEQKRKIRQDTMALVGTLYVEAKRAQDAVALGQTLLERDRRETALAASQVRLGTGSPQALDEAKAREADSERFLAAARADAESRRLDLAAALDLPLEGPISYKEIPEPAPGPEIKEAAVLDAGTTPDVAVARQTLVQREAGAQAIKAGYAPKFSASADYGESGNLPSGSLATYDVGGQVSVPIFEGGSRQKKVDEAEHQIKESRAGLDDAREQAKAKAQSAAQAEEKSWAAVEAAGTALAVSDKDLALAREKLRLGLETAMEEIEEKAKEAQARDTFEEAVAAYQVARVSLEQALGKMDDLTGEGKKAS
jgi:outer membrane protein TolC